MHLVSFSTNFNMSYLDVLHIAFSVKISSRRVVKTKQYTLAGLFASLSPLASVNFFFTFRFWYDVKYFYFHFLLKAAYFATLCVLTIALICSNLTSFWKFQYFRRSMYNPVEHLWWDFYYKNSEPLSIFTKKLHHRCLVGL